MRQPTPDEIVDVMKARGYGSAALKLVPGTVKWCTNFNVNFRHAELYQTGRIFFAGDASRCALPLGGQVSKYLLGWAGMRVQVSKYLLGGQVSKCR